MQDKGKLIKSVPVGTKISKELWDSSFYMKQNELMMKALTEENLQTDSGFSMYTDKGGWEKLPYKKKVCKDPPAKPGDDWWIIL